MKLRSIFAVLVTLVLAGCGHMHHRDGDCSKCGPVDITRPQVSVVNGRIVVDQESLVFGEALSGIAVKITWQLPKGSNFRFPQDGIVFDKAGEEIVCKSEGGQTFACLNRHTKPGRYKYTIKLVPVEPRPDFKAPEPLDPWVIND